MAGGAFIGKLGEFFGSAASAGVSNVVDSVGETIDRFVHTGEEKAEASLAKKELELKFKQMEQDLRVAYMNDRQGARAMYAHDSVSQKVLTVIFTVGFFALTGFLLGLLFKAIEIELSSFTSLFIGSVFGAFATIMTQIVSFYFGSSQTGENQAEKMTDAFNKASNGGE